MAAGEVSKPGWLCRVREKVAMQEAKEEFKDLIERFIALQFLFDKQWRAVKVGRCAPTLPLAEPASSNIHIYHR